jgi:hypothetical protein
MLFLAILHYKKHGRPAQARARPEPGPENKARSCPWDGRGQDFLSPKTRVFSTRPEPGSAREMLRYTCRRGVQRQMYISPKF